MLRTAEAVGHPLRQNGNDETSSRRKPGIGQRRAVGTNDNFRSRECNHLLFECHAFR